MWTIVDFSKHKGKSLPQIILHDPDWFFWAMKKTCLIIAQIFYTKRRA
jgi:hypothetical protein